MGRTSASEETNSPTEAELEVTLGPAYAAWQELRRALGDLCEPSSEQWGFARSAGWGLRVRRRDRIIAYLSPREGHVLVSFALGARAVTAALASDLPDDVVAAVRDARRYVEGTAVRLEVVEVDDVPPVLTIAAAKIAH